MAGPDEDHGEPAVRSPERQSATDRASTADVIDHALEDAIEDAISLMFGDLEPERGSGPPPPPPARGGADEVDRRFDDGDLDDDADEDGQDAFARAVIDAVAEAEAEPDEEGTAPVGAGEPDASRRVRPVIAAINPDEASGGGLEEEEVVSVDELARVMDPEAIGATMEEEAEPDGRDRRSASGLIEIQTLSETYRRTETDASAADAVTPIPAAPPVIAGGTSIYLTSPRPRSRRSSLHLLLAAVMLLMVVITAITTFLLARPSSHGQADDPVQSGAPPRATAVVDPDPVAAPVPDPDPVPVPVPAAVPDPVPAAVPVPVPDPVPVPGPAPVAGASRDSDRTDRDRDPPDPVAGGGEATELRPYRGPGTLAPDDGECDEVVCLVQPHLACCQNRTPPRPVASADPPERPEQPAEPGGAELSRTLAGARAQVAACAERHEFSGTVQVRVRVNPDGSPRRVRVRSGSGAFRRCAAAAIESLRFSTSRRGGVTTYPYTLP